MYTFWCNELELSGGTIAGYVIVTASSWCDAWGHTNQLIYPMCLLTWNYMNHMLPCITCKQVCIFYIGAYTCNFSVALHLHWILLLLGGCETPEWSWAEKGGKKCSGVISGASSTFTVRTKNLAIFLTPLLMLNNWSRCFSNPILTNVLACLVLLLTHCSAKF